VRQTLTIYSPAGVLAKAAPLKLAARRLAAMGFNVTVDEAATARHQRFAGDDETRLAAIHRVARAAPDVALASRGGYGWMRLLDRLDWKLLARSITRGTRWVGYSDCTAMQLALLAHGGHVTWAGPLACDDFGRAEGVDQYMQASFDLAMQGVPGGAAGFRTAAGFNGLNVKGTLWGGNLSMVVSLLGTPHWPQVKRGVLFLEDVNEHPYRVERCLLQLHAAGVLDAQRAIVLGKFNAWRMSPLDRGYGLNSAIAHIRAVTRTPVLTGLPFGHVPAKACLPVGARVTLDVAGRQARIAW
jgi:muramoyltetrapeptide carboxypeptidase